MNEKLSAPNSRIIIYSLPTIIMLFVTAFIFLTPYSHLIRVQIPFHSAIEAAGAIVALILSVLLLSSIDEYPQEFFRVITASAFIGMGMLDLSHSFMKPGQTFVWLHSTAIFLGGVIFSFVWLPKRFSKILLKIPVTVLIFSCCIVLLSILFPEKIPVMLQGNSFTSTAKVLNLIGGLGFFFGSALFFKYYFKSINPHYILFANLCLLFGVSALIFKFSETWDTEWWIWHATRALAYFIALLFIFKIYNDTMEQKDKILDELQDALKNINTLKGLLPICASCKKIRDDKGYWNQIESYIQDHSEAEFSHGICPECAEKSYSDINPYKK